MLEENLHAGAEPVSPAYTSSPTFATSTPPWFFIKHLNCQYCKPALLAARTEQQIPSMASIYSRSFLLHSRPQPQPGCSKCPRANAVNVYVTSTTDSFREGFMPGKSLRLWAPAGGTKCWSAVKGDLFPVSQLFGVSKVSDTQANLVAVV